MPKARANGLGLSIILCERQVNPVMMHTLKRLARDLTPSRVLSLGFLGVILTGGILLALPVSWNPGQHVRFLDALFVSCSAVCVTGLTTVPCGDSFNLFGRTVLGTLIQIGGLGVAALSVTITLLMGRKNGLKARQVLSAAMNFSGVGGLINFLKILLRFTLIFELSGAILCFFVFVQDYPPLQAAGYALFHSVSAFNNAGFDVFGGYDSLLHYAHNVPLNLITMALVIIGGFGFFAMWDMGHCRFKWKKFTLNTKVVTVMTVLLLVLGTAFLYWTTNQTLLEAAFQSVIARTAGFNTHPLSSYTEAALLIFTVLMFIGANPGGTGGGIKTTTFFAVAMKAISSTMRGDRDEVFYRKIPNVVFTQALTVFFYGLTVITVSTILILAFEQDLSLSAVLVEVTSAFATVGSTVGITPGLCSASKIVLMICMFIGRLGPLTIATVLAFKGKSEAHFTEETIMIG